jgi:hypothetical protein
MTGRPLCHPTAHRDLVDSPAVADTIVTISCTPCTLARALPLARSSCRSGKQRREPRVDMSKPRAGRAERPPQRGRPACGIVVRRCCNLQRSRPTMRILTARYQAAGHDLAWRPRPSGAECSCPFYLTRRVFSRDGLYVNGHLHLGQGSCASVPGAAKRGTASSHGQPTPVRRRTRYSMGRP